MLWLLLLSLLQVLEVKSLRVGAFVKVQAECRVAVTRVTKVQPFVLGSVEAVQDVPLQDMQLVQQQVQQLQTTMQVRRCAGRQMRAAAKAGMLFAAAAGVLCVHVFSPLATRGKYTTYQGSGHPCRGFEADTSSVQGCRGSRTRDVEGQ